MTLVQSWNWNHSIIKIIYNSIVKSTKYIYNINKQIIKLYDPINTTVNHL